MFRLKPVTGLETVMQRLFGLKFSIFIPAIFLSVFMEGTWAETVKNGFDLSSSIIPADKIYYGGPARDGIPAIDQPKFLKGENAIFLEPDDRVLGMTYQGITKAYPIKILIYHEIVNDRFASVPVVITYCPLCGSGIAYSARVEGKKYRFGVSGLLYNSDVLLYDKESESLWSQLMRQAISGALKGKRLEPLAVSHTTWQDWINRFPKTLVLSRETGFIRDYSRNPYENYEFNRKIWFPVEKQSDQFHPKEMVLGLELNNQFKAYPFSELAKTTENLNDQLAGAQYSIHFDRTNHTAHVLDEKGKEIPSVITFWFAWYAFHPETLIFKAQ